MKKILLAVLFLCGIARVQAEELVIESLDRNGQMIFNELTNAATYHVEWASSLGGPWTNSWDALNFIPASGSGMVTSSVPMFYRVVMNPTPAGMVKIPGGTNSGTDPDYGAYSLTVEPFDMDKTEVTKQQWDTVYTWATNNNYSFVSSGFGKAMDHPVTSINWYDSVKWCNARSEMERRTPCYTVAGQIYRTGLSTPECNFSANGFRLPTSIESHYAARGGLSGKRFPWGDTITHDQANYYSDVTYTFDTSTTREHHPGYDYGGSPYTNPTERFPANGYGLYDMTGNAWERCSGPAGTSSYIRGGSCLIASPYGTCGYISGSNPLNGYIDVGFRTVCR